ncbi:MAG: phenylalanine--tRNA ligase subunit beta [Candidatus Muirbacterium halophilum]|nr:phenylalanine--tRNA ligase subunit beta [Candidatus Muirbacterium halophilum]MCK9476058.1 phenylalanine--tRNA ligase subunit beta [Candidatus Muirbacterium halophilum]
MKLTYKWLKEFIDIPVSAEELKEIFPKIGLEVDDFYYLGENLENVVTGYVEKCEKHPDADKLSLCTIDNGKEKVQIICGASNVGVGKKVVVANIGANLPGNFQIKKAKLRGVESFGMLCSLKELGLADKSDGIMILPECTPVGVLFKDYYELDDYVYSLETFANRPDHLGVMGIARDLSVFFNIPYNNKKEFINVKSDKNENIFEVKIEDKNACPRYVGRYVEGVSALESPEYIKRRLVACDIRSINFLVDITNYVMLETGHPMHAFDASTFLDKKVIIRYSEKNEFSALNENKYKLNQHDLVIADSKKPVAIAGIIGGIESEVKEKTGAIFLESACFEPKGIAKTSKKIGLKTDSSSRFEKHADVNMAEYAIDLASYLLKKHGGDNIMFFNKIDNYPLKEEEKTVVFNVEKIKKYIGCDIPQERINEIIERLPVDRLGKNLFKIHSCRKDINLEVDIVEEIAKFYGYDNIEAKDINIEAIPYYNKLSLYFDFSFKLSDLGFNEVKNFSLVNNKQQNSPALINPLNEDMAFMRTQMYKGLLKNIEYNSKRGVENHFYFETGKVYLNNKNSYNEKYVISGIASGKAFKHPQISVDVDYYYLKGIVDNILNSYNVEYSRSEQVEFLHPGMCAKIISNGKEAGFVGKLHPSIRSRFFNEVYYFEIYPEFLQAKQQDYIKELSIYPGSKFDLSLIVPEEVDYSQIKNTISKLNIDDIESMTMYDMFKGGKIPENTKSLTFRLIFSNASKTLSDVEINLHIQNILNALKNIQVTLRAE